VYEREITKFHSAVNPRRGKNSLGAFVRPLTFIGERKISGIFKEKLLKRGRSGRRREARLCCEKCSFSLARSHSTPCKFVT